MCDFRFDWFRAESALCFKSRSFTNNTYSQDTSHLTHPHSLMELFLAKSATGPGMDLLQVRAEIWMYPLFLGHNTLYILLSNKLQCMNKLYIYIILVLIYTT